MQTGTYDPLEMVRGCIKALSDEMYALSQRKARPWTITDGQRIAVQGDGRLYSFTVDAEILVPDDSPAKLYIKGKLYKATVVGVVSFTVLLLVESAEAVPESVPVAQLVTDPTFLLASLRDRLNELSESQPATLGLASRLLASSAKDPSVDLVKKLRSNAFIVPSLNEPQIQAIARVRSNDVAFVWGPPGTGKTKTLAHTVATLIQSGSTVLVAAHSNAAVNVAALALADIVHTWDSFKAGQIVRVGVARAQGMVRYPEMQPRVIAGRSYPLEFNTVEQLEQERDRLMRQLTPQLQGRSSSAPPLPPGVKQNDETSHLGPAQRLVAVRKELKTLYDQLKQAERNVTREAQVVLATLSKTAIAEEIYSRHFDAVIVDEASMAYIPANVHLASLATKHFAAFGDFRQLPPIVQGETAATKFWLNPDIFERAGIVDSVKDKHDDPRLATLNIQYRMHRDIAAIVNQFYGGLLRTDGSVFERCRELLPLPPRDGQSVTLLDTKALHPFAFKEAEVLGQRRDSNSRFNPISALVAVELAQAQLRDATSRISIGIITPYAAQARLINKLIVDMRLPRDQVKCATVHRFQGSESDVIIYDIVEGKLFTKVGWLVASPRGEDQDHRLLNVALSRAKGKLILLADVPHLDKVLPAHNIYREVLRKLRDKNGQKRSGWLPIIPLTRTGTGLWRVDPLPGVIYYPHNPAIDDIAATRLADELRSANEIAIARPSIPPASTPVYSALTPALVHSNFPPLARLYVSDADAGMLPISSEQQSWPGPKVPWLVIGIDKLVLWIENTGYALRLELPSAVKLLYALWHLLPDGPSNSVLENAAVGKPTHPNAGQSNSVFGRLCPKCDSPLFPQSSPGGYVSVVCQNNACDYRTYITPQVATEMALLFKLNCPECNGILVGAPGNWGVYLRCAKYPACKGHRRVKELV